MKKFIFAVLLFTVLSTVGCDNGNAPETEETTRCVNDIDYLFEELQSLYIIGYGHGEEKLYTEFLYMKEAYQLSPELQSKITLSRVGVNTHCGICSFVNSCDGNKYQVENAVIIKNNIEYYCLSQAVQVCPDKFKILNENKIRFNNTL